MTPKHVASLELAQKLKELGFPQTGVFSYVFPSGMKEDWQILYDYREVEPSRFVKISAFTVAELGELLPPEIKTYKINNGITIEWWCYQDYGQRKCFVSSTEPDCRAKMLIYLHENGLMGGRI